MNTPPIPHTPEPGTDLAAKVNQWLELKREMETLHAQLEYVRLLVRLGVYQR